MTEREIVNSLMIYYRQYRYRVNNVYVFNWESDFIAVARSGYIIECEIKTSRSDFFADMKKDKHKIMQDQFRKNFIPHRFMYVVPRGLIDKTEVPAYAGLMYANGLEIVKTPPLLHKKQYDIRNILCDKYYYKWLDSRNNLRKSISVIEKYRNSLFGDKLINQLNNAY